ncbi:tyrosine-type recombinase/integrase [bacterium]|nr:tyrosine-type recombinase/integrase [bacterium]
MRFGNWVLTIKKHPKTNISEKNVKHGNWILEPDKYLNKKQANRLLKAVEFRAKLATAKKQKIAIRDYFIIHLGLSTGLRVMEMAALKCGDLFLDERLCSVLVRKGKGDKRRLVYFTEPFSKHCKQFLRWKHLLGESVEPEAPLIVSSNTGFQMTTRALQYIFKRCGTIAHIDPHYSIHCLRHTYACFLLKASNWNLRLVQKQLGHSRITTTQVYADVMLPQIEKALNRMYR